jgi:hypothetical protein
MEHAGAGLAIVVDNSNKKIDEVLMSDDGTGTGIRIPSVLISKQDGETIIDYLTTAN